MTGISGLYKNTYGAKVARGEIIPYKERMKEEYHQLKERYEKLCTMLDKHKKGELDFTPTCSIILLEEQADCMQKYLHILECRAEIEDVNLE